MIGLGGGGGPAIAIGNSSLSDVLDGLLMLIDLMLRLLDRLLRELLHGEGLGLLDQLLDLLRVLFLDRLVEKRSGDRLLDLLVLILDFFIRDGLRLRGMLWWQNIAQSCILN